MNAKLLLRSVTYMDWKSAAALVIALFSVSFAATQFPLIAHKGFHAISASNSSDMSNLSAEEINRRTLELAANVKLLAK